MSKKLTNDELIMAIVNKELEPFGKTWDDIVNDKEWLGKFEVSEEEEQKWIEWSTDFLKKNAKEHAVRNRAKEEMSWLILGWGLPIKGQNSIYKKVKKYPRIKDC